MPTNRQARYLPSIDLHTHTGTNIHTHTYAHRKIVAHSHNDSGITRALDRVAVWQKQLFSEWNPGGGGQLSVKAHIHNYRTICMYIYRVACVCVALMPLVSHKESACESERGLWMNIARSFSALFDFSRATTKSNAHTHIHHHTHTPAQLSRSFAHTCTHSAAGSTCLSFRRASLSSTPALSLSLSPSLFASLYAQIHINNAVWATSWIIRSTTFDECRDQSEV